MYRPLGRSISTTDSVVRIRIVIEVEALSDEQARRFGELRVERVAGVRMPDLHAGAGRPCAEQPPCLQDVYLAKTPFEDR